MLFPRETDFDFYRDSFKFLGMLAIVATLGLIVDIAFWVHFDTKGLMFKLVIKSLEIITICIPPTLPVCLQIGVSIAIERL
mmetsp:Transcript_15332/g.13061  ORF Transcript_15332/g.13061 Transcript_15332/m.13061 type:complete len:81 (+) Transcript_15332:1065-1307(+)